MTKTNLIFTTAAEHLVKYFENQAGFSIIPINQNKDKNNIFPDGEVYVRIDKIKEIKDERIVVIHTGSPNPNSGLIELEMILSVFNHIGAKNVEVFFTYFPYGMQDKIFEEGETNAAEDLIRKLAEYHKVKKIYAIEPHFSKEPWLTKHPFISISAHEVMIESAKKEFPDAVFAAPDLGHEKRTKVKGFKKTRVDSYNVTIEHDKTFMENLKGKNVGVIDDIIETGGTMVRVYDECKKYQPAKIFAVATHGIMESGIKKIKGEYEKLFLSNTVATPESNVDIFSLILKNIK